MNRRMSYQWAFIFVNTITYALIQVICIIGIETGWWFPPWAGGVIYVVMLGIAIGVEIAAGAFIAPVIFFPQKYLGEGVLTHFQSGILMTQVFLKTNMLLMIVAVYSLLF